MITIERWSSDQIAGRTAIWIADRVWTAVARHGRADIAVSGGSSPAIMLAQLATLPLPYRALHVWQVDERCAPDDSADRNLHQLAALRDCGAEIHSLPVTAPDLEAAFVLPTAFDVVHLGVGEDGHTASWAPDQKSLWHNAQRPLIVSDEFNGFRRITITPKVVYQARHVVVLAPGDAKRQVLIDWVKGRSTRPIAHIRSATLMTDCQLENAKG
jgi:6-phosphogluconolactonase